MTTPTSMGNHGGTVTSCSPYAYPGFAEMCILHRTWSTVALGTYELAFLINKKKECFAERTLPASPQAVYRATALPLPERARVLKLALATLQKLSRAGAVLPGGLLTKCSSLVPLGAPQWWVCPHGRILHGAPTC